MIALTQMLKRLGTHIVGHKMAVGIVVLACLFGGGVALLRNSSSGEEMLVVHPKEFVQQVSVSGTVIAAQEAELGFTASGRVAHTYVRVGEAVRAGAVLAEIENGDVRAAVSERLASLASQEAKLASLKAGTRPEELALAHASVESASASLAQAHEAVIQAIRDAYTASDGVVRNTVDQFIIDPRSAVSALSFYTSNSQIAVNTLARRTTMEGILTRWQAQIAAFNSTSDTLAAAQEAQYNLTQMMLLLSDSAAALTSAQPSQSTSAATIATYASAVASARTSINAAASALTGAVTAQRNASAALDQARKTLTLKEAGSTQEDIAVQAAQVAAARADVDSARAQLARTLILAPFSGTVTRMDITEGEIVSPNEPKVALMSVDRLHIESYIPEISVSLVRPDNEAVITLDAYGAGTTFAAKVASVDPAETIRNGVPMYRSILEFLTQDSRIKSGMTANVAITTARRENVISVPQRIVSSRGGKQYVLVRVGEGLEDREVTTGAVSALGEIEILSGLSDGETVVLTIAS